MEIKNESEKNSEKKSLSKTFVHEHPEMVAFIGGALPAAALIFGYLSKK